MPSRCHRQTCFRLLFAVLSPLALHGCTPVLDVAADSEAVATIVEVLDSYDAALRRINGDQCTGAWSHVGTCGPWDFVTETSGFAGTTSYFDPDGGLIVALERFDDVQIEDEPERRFVFGTVDCLPEVAQTIPCVR